eukprot:6491777-Amphidinium_carterae.1
MAAAAIDAEMDLDAAASDKKQEKEQVSRNKITDWKRPKGSNMNRPEPPQPPTRVPSTQPPARPPVPAVPPTWRNKQIASAEEWRRQHQKGYAKEQEDSDGDGQDSQPRSRSPPQPSSQPGPSQPDSAVASTPQQRLATIPGPKGGRPLAEAASSPPYPVREWVELNADGASLEVKVMLNAWPTGRDVRKCLLYIPSTMSENMSDFGSTWLRQQGVCVLTVMVDALHKSRRKGAYSIEPPARLFTAVWQIYQALADSGVEEICLAGFSRGAWWASQLATHGSKFANPPPGRLWQPTLMFKHVLLAAWYPSRQQTPADQVAQLEAIGMPLTMVQSKSDECCPFTVGADTSLINALNA